MYHFHHLSESDSKRLFFSHPEEFTLSYEKELLATALGGTLYSPSIRPNLAADLTKLYNDGVLSSVICLEDSIPDDRVEEGEANIQRTLIELDSPRYEGRLPMLFVRVRTPEHLARVAEQNRDRLHLLAGFVLPKFEDLTGTATRYMEVMTEINAPRLRQGLRPIYFMPVLESPMMAHRESREATLTGIHSVLAAHRDWVLAVRIGATDLSSVYALRRNPDITIYDVNVIAAMIGDVVNIFGRAGVDGYTITGPVWEHFHPHDRYLKPQLRESPFQEDTAMRRGFVTEGFDMFIKEIMLDQANGILGKTVIHPTHVDFVHALSVPTHEEYSDALDIVDQANALGGAKASTYRNKMNEVKPHLAWANKTLLRARAFGVMNEGIDFVDFLEVLR